MIHDMGVEQLVDRPTSEENTLDLFLSNLPSRVPRAEVMPGISDHCIPYIELDLNPPKKRHVRRPIPQYYKADWDKLKTGAEALSKKITSYHTPDSSVEEMWTTLRDGLLGLVKEHVPHKIPGKSMGQRRNKEAHPTTRPDTQKVEKNWKCKIEKSVCIPKT
ncbi:hypothetical protein ACOMHN_058534 [Nucella lapillus]